MPYLKSDAPLDTPDTETLESLLGKRNNRNSRLKRIKTIQDLTDAEKRRSGLITIGKRCTKIPGDPFGVYPSWAGNVSHPEDERMFDIMPPIFEDLIQGKVVQSDQLNAIEQLLSKVPSTGVIQLATDIANEANYNVIKETVEETVVDFSMGSFSVRLMNMKDVDMHTPSPYNHTLRARTSVSRANYIFNEPIMNISLQQYVMARLLRDGTGQLDVQDSYDETENEADPERL